MPRLEKTVLGEKLAYPVAIARFVVYKIFRPASEPTIARAAAKLGVPYTLSSATCTSIEDVAKAHGIGCWLHGAIHDGRHVCDGLAAFEDGSRLCESHTEPRVLVIGLSVVPNPLLAVDNIGVEIGFSDPVFQQRFHKKYGQDIAQDIALAAQEWAGIIMAGTSHDWEDVNHQKHWDGPIVIKGIQTVGDAKRAVEVGIQGIVVFNHGGRQQDDVAASLDYLPAIAQAVGSDIDVLFDSAIRSGVDILEALALGARCVLIGRPCIFGLGIQGQAGVEHVLKALLGKMQMTLHQAGVGPVGLREPNEGILLKVQSCCCVSLHRDVQEMMG